MKRTEDRWPPSRNNLALDKVRMALREVAVVNSPEASLGRSVASYSAPTKMQMCKQPRHFYRNTHRAFYSIHRYQATPRNTYLNCNVQWAVTVNSIDIHVWAWKPIHSHELQCRVFHYYRSIDLPMISVAAQTRSIKCFASYNLRSS